MSRLPLPEKPKETSLPAEFILLVEHLEQSPVTASHIKTWTRRDPLLARVLRHLHEEWPESSSDPALRPYWSHRAELSHHDGCLLWGGRVIVPQPGRESVLKELHGGHPGSSRMKTLARMFVWWPGMEADIKSVVQQCQQFSTVSKCSPHLLLCSLGAGQANHGHGFTWITQGLFWVTCFWFWWTPTRNGWKYTACPPQLHMLPFRSCERCSLSLGYHTVIHGVL